jgi:hypothetical protein
VENPVTQKLPPKLNAAKHWMTSRQPLIPNESREALQAHLEHWNNLYPDVETDELLSDFVREAAFSSWLLIRSQRQYDSSLAKLHETDMDDWTPEQNKTYQLRERYLNAAHRRLNRHRSDILQYQSNLRAQARENRAASDYANEEAAKEEAKKKDRKETEPRPPHKHNGMVLQTIDVCQENGETKTHFTPANDHLLDHISKFRYETTLVLRGVLFKDHIVPPEYEAFTERAAELKGLPNIGRIELPITFRSLRIAVEREKEFGGHVRDWPDLRAADEQIIQLHLNEGKKE